MQYIEKTELKNVWKLEELDFERMYIRMKASKTDVIYVLQGEKLAGVISIGDYLRHYREGKDLKLNTNFRYVTSVEEKEVERVLMEIPAIHELPVVNTDNRFLGVIRVGQKSDIEIYSLFSYIDNKRYEEYMYQTFREWLVRQKCTVIVYCASPGNENLDTYIPNYSVIRKKRTEKNDTKQPNSLYVLSNMDRQQSVKFFGADYKENISKKIIKDIGNIEIEYRNGMY